MSVVLTVIGIMIGYFAGSYIAHFFGLTGSVAWVVIGMGAVAGWLAWIYSPLPDVTDPTLTTHRSGWGWPDARHDMGEDQ